MKNYLFFIVFISIESYLRIVGKNNYDYADGLMKYRKNHQFSRKNEIGETVEIRTDKYGFRNENRIYEDNKKEKVVVLGDSYVANINSNYERSLPRKGR